MRDRQRRARTDGAGVGQRWLPRSAQRSQPVRRCRCQGARRVGWPRHRAFGAVPRHSSRLPRQLSVQGLTRPRQAPLDRALGSPDHGRDLRDRAIFGVVQRKVRPLIRGQLVEGAADGVGVDECVAHATGRHPGSPASVTMRISRTAMRRRRRSMSRQRLTRLRVSHASKRAGSRSRGSSRQAAIHVSWAASSASASLRRIDQASRQSLSCRWLTNTVKAASSPPRARSTSDAPSSPSAMSRGRRLNPAGPPFCSTKSSTSLRPKWLATNDQPISGADRQASMSSGTNPFSPPIVESPGPGPGQVRHDGGDRHELSVDSSRRARERDAPAPDARAVVPCRSLRPTQTMGGGGYVPWQDDLWSPVGCSSPY